MQTAGLARRLATERRRPEWVRARPDAWRLAVATVCLGGFMGQLDASIVTVALPTLQRDLHAGVTAVAWVGLAYLVTLVSTVGVVGRVSDVVGRKLVYVYGFGVFTVASALCAIAPSLGVLLAFRVLQGLGAAMLQANSVAIVALAAPRARVGRAIGVQGAAQALGLAAGPTVGGVLLALGGWRLLFILNVPAGLVAIVLGILLIPRSTQLRHGARVDATGLALLVLAVAGGLCAISLAGVRGAGATAAVLGAAAIGLVVAFVAHERRAATPLLDVEVLANRAVGLGVAGAGASYAVLFGVLVAAPFYLERGLGLGVAGTGLALAAMPVAMGIAAPLAGHASERVGTRALSVAGMAVCAVALAGLAVAHGSAGAVAAWLALVGMGAGCFTPTNNAAALRAAPMRNAAEVSGLLNMGRGLGTAVGVAVTSVLLSVAAGTWASGRATAVVAWVLCAVAAGGAVLAEAASRGTASTSGARGVVAPADAA